MNDVALPYRPRQYQKDFENAMFGGMKRAFLLYHRRAGKDIACWNFCINCALSDRPGLYFYALPTYTQGKRVIWDGIDERGNKLIQSIPRELLVGKPNSTEMKINLVNGSMIQIVGAENFDALRGTNPKGCVFSEYAMQDPRAWTEVISPILAKNGGWAVFNTTPLGKNHAFDLWQMAERSDAWFTQKLTIADTGLIPRTVIEQEIAEGKGEEVIQQEYYCSFSRGVDGTYYGRLISKAWDDGRICSVPYDPSLDVNTSWDLGVGDATSIWFWQQSPGGEIHFIDFYENTGEGLAHYVSVLREKDFLYGKHYLPHDVKARELGSGASREEMLRKLQVKPVIVPKLSIDDGIQAVRSILPRCWFDEKKCAVGIKHLENYRKAFSNTLRCYTDRPLHDQASNACFVAGTLITTRGGKLPIEKIKRGDEVLTPNGYKRVSDSYIYESSNLFRVTTQGSTLRCTGNHKIFTTRGLVYADTLRYNDVLLNEKDISLCKKIGSLGREIGLGFRDYFLSLTMKKSFISTGLGMYLKGIITERECRDSRPLALFKELFGLITTVRYLRNITSIIKTETLRIMSSQTLNQFQPVTIPSSIIPKKKERRAEKPSFTQWNLRKNGIPQKKDLCGIVKMEKHVGRIVKETSLVSVECAKSRSKHISSMQNTVLAPVNKNGDTNQELISGKRSVKSAKSLLQSINTKRHARVLSCAPQNSVLIQKVYDLEVESEHCYFANDILVSNSDSLRYAAVAMSKSGRSGMTEEDAERMANRYAYNT